MGGCADGLRGPWNGALQPERGVFNSLLVWLVEEEGGCRRDKGLDNKVPSRINKVGYQSLLIQTLPLWLRMNGTSRAVRRPCLVC